MTDTQPFLHDLLAAVAAPGLVLCGADGQILERGVQGAYLNDRRIISLAHLEIGEPGEDLELAPVLGELSGAGATRSVAVLRGVGNRGADPSVWCERHRSVHGDEIVETITVRSAAHEDVTVALTLSLACDLADIAVVKAGSRPQPLAPAGVADGLRWTAADGTEVRAVASPAPDEVRAGSGALRWRISVPHGAAATVRLRYRLTHDPVPTVVWPVSESQLAEPTVASRRPGLPQLVAQSLADLRGLELCDPLAPADHFIGAGVPWYLTLFGRDALITARMLLPLGTGVAAGTLRTLARRQGSALDPAAAEEPGKILHELRRDSTQHGAASHAAYAMQLPPVYYGTVDATALWVMLLHDSWRWGLAADEVEALLPTLGRALAWMRDYGAGEHGFLTYADASGHGLANQGWKDSSDAIQFADGRLADAPVALAEVQAYAYAAATGGAALLDAFDRPGGDEWRAWAATLAERFRQRFWVSDEFGPFPAMALDAHGVPVDAVASNMGHLLGTGLLNAAESATVARRLARPELSGAAGLRTMATSAAGFNPLSYHCGSVWTHDTAIAVSGLSRAAADGVDGAAETAAVLIDRLLAAAAGFGYRMPELHSGEDFDAAAGPGGVQLGGAVTPYPASCRPQAWSAASGVAVLTAILGLYPDAPTGRLPIRPLRPSPVGELTVTGLQLAGERLDVAIAADGSLLSSTWPTAVGGH